jgi:hypothetical protein
MQEGIPTWQNKREVKPCNPTGIPIAIVSEKRSGSERQKEVSKSAFGLGRVRIVLICNNCGGSS